MENLIKIITQEKKNEFENFFSLLIEYNNKYNLTAIKDKNEVYVKHFLDSLLGLEFFKDGSSVIEIGSGGGFPSIPLMIVNPTLKFTLVESTNKKCVYLREVVEKLSLNCGQVLSIRAEDGGRDPLYREKFDYVTARAVARLNTLCEYCLPFLKVGGTFIAYKGDASEEVSEAQNAIKKLGCQLQKVVEYELPEGMGKRNLVIIKKVKPTPSTYPRGNGKERKQPL